MTKPCSRHELSRVASVPPSGYAGTNSADRRKMRNADGREREKEAERRREKRGKRQKEDGTKGHAETWKGTMTRGGAPAFIGPYRPTVG